MNSMFVYECYNKLGIWMSGSSIRHSLNVKLSPIYKRNISLVYSLQKSCAYMRSNKFSRLVKKRKWKAGNTWVLIV
jgi:hypothetical protein